MIRAFWFGLSCICMLAFAGCGTTGSGSSATSVPAPAPAPVPAPATAIAPQFSPSAGAYPIAQTLTLQTPTAGATIYYTTDGSLPTTASRAYTGSLAVKSSQLVRAFAAGPSLTPSDVASAAYSIVPPTVSVNHFDFGDDLVGNTLTKTVATIANTLPAAVPVTYSVAGDASFTLPADQPCGSTLAPNSTCSLNVAYNPAASGMQTGSVAVQFTGSSDPPTQIDISGTAAAVPAATVTPTQNPQVANYSVTAPFGGTVTVEFGPDTTYGFKTSAKPTPTSDGGPVDLLVAGMREHTAYHLRATIHFTNGLTYTDSDHTFTTGDLPPGSIPGLVASTSPGMTPQAGVELIDMVFGQVKTSAIVTDLAGKVIWTYLFPDQQDTALITPIRFLPNGNMLTAASFNSTVPLHSPIASDAIVELREVDLAGTVVRRLSMAELNRRLVIAGFPGLPLLLYHHEVLPLPNGHTLVLANLLKSFDALPGATGTTDVLGDVIVDLNQDLTPVWVWNSFDHLDVNRHPMGFPDWTHGNAITYSPDDGNLLFSMRHQHWVIKLNYKDGQGDGSILWKLGWQGDFTLQGGVDPTDWFYGQHSPVFFSPNSTGVFSLGLMDNGNDRPSPDGSRCQGSGPLCYSTIMVLQVDEAAKTAKITSNEDLPADQFNLFAGDVAQMGNGNIEFNLAGLGINSLIYEVTPTNDYQTVWQMSIRGTNTYRANRIPSLYPGVTWPATTQ